MELRDRVRKDKERQAAGPGPDSGGEGLGALREQLDRVMAAGDRAINQVLSGNSESFLQRGRQQGGQ